MFRTILKVIYVGLAFFMGMIMYMGQYQSNGFDAILKRANGYIEEENFDELARMLGGIVNQDEVLTINKATDDNMILLYEGTTLSQNTTYKKVTDDKNKEGFEATENISFNDAYFMMIMNPSFGKENLSGEKPLNNTSIVFTTANKTYNYKMVQNAAVNADFYDEHPKTINEAILEGARDMLALEDAYGFFSLIFDSQTISAIESELGEEVTGFYIADNEGHKVANTEASFDFTFESEFFTAMQPLQDQYGIYIDGYQKHEAGTIKNDEFKTINDNFESFTKTFDEKLNTEESMKNYKKGFEQKELVSSAVMWKTIGQMTIYAVVAIALYFLLFKFGQVVAMFSALWGKITGKAPKGKPKRSKKEPVKMSAKDTSNREPIVKSLANDDKDTSSPAEEEAPEEDTPAEEAKAEEAPVEEAPVEEAPVEEAKAEEAPIDLEEKIEAPAIEAEVVDENPLSEVVADAPLEDAEEAKKSE